MKKAESLRFLQLFVYRHCGDTWFCEKTIEEISGHVDNVANDSAGFMDEPVLLETLYDVFNPNDLETGQSSVKGFSEFEKKLSNLVQGVRLKLLPRVH